MSYIIQVKGLQKRYGPIKAVDDISFQVEEGRLFDFLGPNGAGKSTTIDIICTLLQPESGTMEVNRLRLGEDNDTIREAIEVVFQKGLLDDFLIVRENLQVRRSGGLIVHVPSSTGQKSSFWMNPLPDWIRKCA